jgi:T-complex protein 1 subunit eta
MLACSFMKEAKPYIEEGVHPQVIVRAYRQAAAYALAQIKDIAVKVDKADPKEMRSLLEKCAATTLCSKLVATQKVGGIPCAHTHTHTRARARTIVC